MVHQGLQRLFAGNQFLLKLGQNRLRPRQDLTRFAVGGEQWLTLPFLKMGRIFIDTDRIRPFGRALGQDKRIAPDMDRDVGNRPTSVCIDKIIPLFLQREQGLGYGWSFFGENDGVEFGRPNRFRNAQGGDGQLTGKFEPGCR